VADGAIAGQLDRVKEFEAARRITPVTRLLRRVGPTRGFARIYRRLGPAIDPWVLRRAQGRIVSRVYGLPILLLSTIGRRSGEARVSPLVYVRDGRDFAVVGTNFGQHQHPGWTANLLAQSEVAIEVGPERLGVRAALADDATWKRLWPRFLDVYPGYQDYLSRTGGRKPRMFLLHPAD
jgi:deazaflavin-dependent oxidoreductase (nitroreductase family)